MNVKVTIEHQAASQSPKGSPDRLRRGSLCAGELRFAADAARPGCQPLARDRARGARAPVGPVRASCTGSPTPGRARRPSSPPASASTPATWSACWTRWRGRAGLPASATRPTAAVSSSSSAPPAPRCCAAPSAPPPRPRRESACRPQPVRAGPAAGAARPRCRPRLLRLDVACGAARLAGGAG